MWSAFSYPVIKKKIIIGLSQRLVLFALSSICPDTESSNCTADGLLATPSNSLSKGVSLESRNQREMKQLTP